MPTAFRRLSSAGCAQRTSIICSKCGVESDGSIAGFNPCHLRDPVQDHNFVHDNSSTIVSSRKRALEDDGKQQNTYYIV